MCLFGTNQKTAKAESFEISINGCSIPNSEKYEYVGVVYDAPYWTKVCL